LITVLLSWFFHKELRISATKVTAGRNFNFGGELPGYLKILSYGVFQDFFKPGMTIANILP
jgi:hypothetical protein